MKTILTTVCIACFAACMAQDNPPSITTIGTAHVYVEPDEVLVDVYLENEDNDLEVASEKTDKQAIAVLKVCREFKIAPEHAQSTRRNYGRNWRYKDGRPKYKASQTISICLKDLDNYDEFIGAIIKLDVANVGGAQFRTTKHREMMDKARVKAMLAAKEKAVLLASQYQQEVGRALDIKEGSMGSMFRGGQMAYANTAFESGASESAVDGSAFSPGQLKIEAQVTVTFALN